MLVCMDPGDVVAIAVKTTDTGPFAEDVFWWFAMRDGTVHELPGNSVSGERLAMIQHDFPGLDNAKVILAMSTTRERTYSLWRREAAPATLPRDALIGRFSTLVDSDEAAPVAHALLEAWSGTGRSYHTLEHLSDCLREADAAGGAPAPVELALWYHDAIYEPRTADSEARSADRLLADSSALGIDGGLAARAAELVRATAHLSRQGVAPASAEEALVLDIDLAILGSHPFRFMDFEHGIEEEYASVPRPIFFFKRKKFLERLLASPRIYATDAFHSRLDAAARSNLQQLLDSPRYRWTSWIG